MDVRLEHLLGEDKELQDLESEEQVLADLCAVVVGHNNLEVLESRPTRGQIEESAWDRPRTR